MTRQEQRYRRLTAEGFAPFEARGFSDTKITQPAMMLLRKERRAALREAKKLGIPRKALNRQIATLYRAEGHFKAHRYQPLTLFETYEAKQQAIEEGRLRKLRAEERREERAGKPEEDKDYKRRFNILIDCGFLPFEARILATMAHIKLRNRKRVFDTFPWKAMRKTRGDLVQRLHDEGYSDREIRRMIRRWYRMGKVKDPYDFLRKEGSPGARRAWGPRPPPLVYRLLGAVIPKKQRKRRPAMIWD